MNPASQEQSNPELSAHHFLVKSQIPRIPFQTLYYYNYYYYYYYHYAPINVKLEGGRRGRCGAFDIFRVFQIPHPRDEKFGQN